MDRRKSEVIKALHVTEKSSVLSSLKDKESNKSLRAFTCEKHTFVVANWANKIEIRKEIEDVYKEQNVKVKKVNIVNLPGKVKTSRKRGIRHGAAKLIKKAIVTLHEGSSLGFES
jgi:large subunit ribosomal protein L23